MAIHSQVNSEYFVIHEQYYNWISGIIILELGGCNRKRVRHSDLMWLRLGFYSILFLWLQTCVPAPPCTLHRPNGIFLPSNYKTREISNYLQFHQIVAAEERGSEWSSLPLAVITRGLMIGQSGLSIEELGPIRGQLVRSKIALEWSWYWPHHLDQFLLTSRS